MTSSPGVSSTFQNAVRLLGPLLHVPRYPLHATRALTGGTFATPPHPKGVGWRMFHITLNISNLPSHSTVFQNRICTLMGIRTSPGRYPSARRQMTPHRSCENFDLWDTCADTNDGGILICSLGRKEWVVLDGR